MTRTITTTTIRTTITTGDNAPQRGAELEALRTPWTVDTTRDTAAHQTDATIATLLLADTVHLNAHPNDPVIAAALLTCKDPPTVHLKDSDTSLPRDILRLPQINPTMVTSTGVWI